MQKGKVLAALKLHSHCDWSLRGYSITGTDASDLPNTAVAAMTIQDTELTSCFSGTYLARTPQRTPNPMPPMMDRGPCIIWKTSASET